MGGEGWSKGGRGWGRGRSKRRFFHETKGWGTKWGLSVGDRAYRGGKRGVGKAWTPGAFHALLRTHESHEGKRPGGTAALHPCINVHSIP